MMPMTRKFLKQISSELIPAERRHDPIRKGLSSFYFILIANVDGKVKALRKESPLRWEGRLGEMTGVRAWLRPLAVHLTITRC